MTDTLNLPSNRHFRAFKRIVVTRTEEQSASLASEMTRLGAIVMVVPVIKIEPATLSGGDRSVLNGFHDYDFAVFTSVNAVINFFRVFNPDTTVRRRPAIIAVGSKTESAIQEFGFTPDFVPEKFNSKELLKSMGTLNLKGRRVLIPKGNLSGSEIAEFVRTNGGFPDEIVVYRTVPNESIDERLKKEISSGQFDTAVFFSPSQVKNFLNIFGVSVLKGKQIAAIGPTTKKAAEQLGLTVDVVPENSTTEELIVSLLEHEEN
ncbi:MAG: uroporphyrinogen-III synthase [Bacteroidetes bacterium]|nr:uroporphyrinogen-III synthase [Bacteroidota bacterium]